ncbi:MAG TPA: cytochrome c [Conexibacter sp.]|nr:cytochrome c [Conexibacter sp.]
MRRIHALLVVLALAALVAGCGGNGGGSDANGSATAPATATQAAPTQAQATGTTKAPAPKPAGPDGARVFASAGCGSCHTLKAAGATGGVGPNLDDLKPSADAVKAQVSSGGGGMPSFSGSLSGAEIDAVASYVAANAGR